MIDSPSVLWHWVTCAGCGGTVCAKNQDMRHQAVRPLCCTLIETPALFGKEPPADARIHPTSDTTKRMVCMTCGHQERFGAPSGERAGEENEADMRKIKAPKSHGVGSKDASNGKPIATLGDAIQGKSKGKRPERVERAHHFEFLPVRVPDADKLAAHAELSKLEGDRLALKSQKHEVLARFREKFNALDVDIEKLVEKGNDGVVKRRVECVDYLLPTNEIETIRLDSGEVVERRTARADELQENLADFVSSSKDEKKKGGKGKKDDGTAAPPAREPAFGELELPEPSANAGEEASP